MLVMQYNERYLLWIGSAPGFCESTSTGPVPLLVDFPSQRAPRLRLPCHQHTP